MQQFSSRGKLCVVRAESSIFTIRVGRPLLFLLSGVINGHLMLAGLVFPHFCCILFFNLGSKWKASVAARIAAIIIKKRKGPLLQFWFCKKVTVLQTNAHSGQKRQTVITQLSAYPSLQEYRKFSCIVLTHSSPQERDSRVHSSFITIP